MRYWEIEQGAHTPLAYTCVRAHTQGERIEKVKGYQLDLNENAKDFCARQEESVGRGERQEGVIWGKGDKNLTLSFS